jgi:4-hydroxy-tetrahydrodipicolinate synthase
MSAQELRSGVFNITPTPFHQDGTLDLPSVGKLTEFTIGCGVDGLTILGVLGEADKLLDAERDRVIAATVEAAAGRVPICVGTTHAGTDACAALSRRAQELGAAAVMVAPPKLLRPTDAALRRHYLTVAAAVDLPVVVQDHPTSSGVPMTVEFLARLGEEAPSCRFVKLEDEPTPPKLTQLLAANPKLRIYGGLGGSMFYEELRRGAIGIMTGFGFPEVLVEIHRAFVAGETARAAEVFYRHSALIRFENQARINLVLRKHLYARRGAMAQAHARFPAPELDAGTLRDLGELVTGLGLMKEW